MTLSLPTETIACLSIPRPGVTIGIWTIALVMTRRENLPTQVPM